MKPKVMFWLLLAVVVIGAGSGVASADVGWMQPRVRVWYLGGVGDSDMSSNAEEAYLIQSITGTTASVKYHSALTHWTSPKPVQVGTYSTVDMGPCWIHPQRLQTVKEGEYWRSDQRITLVERAKTYNDLPYRMLPALALLDLAPQRQVVKITYKIDPQNPLPTGSAYFDAQTGLLLYHNSMWAGTKMFFILAEINYDFQRHVVLPEDNGPHTGFRSFVSERSQGVFTGFMFIGGGSITIHSMVESRYGATLRMLVLPSMVPSNFGTAYRNFAFFGDVPIVRQMEYPQSTNVRPEQWTPFGQHLWWWLPPTVTGGLAIASATASIATTSAISEAAVQAINVFGVPMTKTADQPLTYTATQTPQRFHFTTLKFDSDGYMTEFAARDPTTGLNVQPGDFNYWNCKGAVPPGDPAAACVDGRTYFGNSMALPPLPVPDISSIDPASGPTAGGTTVTIAGKNFVAGGTSVTFAGAAATDVSVQGATSLTCKVPAGTAGRHDVILITAGGSDTAAGAFEYVEGAVVMPPADPAQPVTVSVPVTGGAIGATFKGVKTAGWLMAAPVAVPTPPIAKIAFLPGTAFLLRAPDVTFTSATVCLPYAEAGVVAAGLREETLMVWHQPTGSATWVDVTSSHDPAGNRICALMHGFSPVVVAGANAAPLAHGRYLAEGATSSFFGTRIALVNPSSSVQASVLLRFQRADTTTRVRFVSVPPLGRRTTDVTSVPEMANAEFSTVIESDQPVVVDRTMLWDATGYGSHAETSVASPATTWYLAEGATHGGFNLFYLLQNPNTADAQVRVRYLRPGGAPLEKTYTLPPDSRTNIWVDFEEFPGLGQPRASTDVSAVFEVLNGQPIIVERAMYSEVPGQVFGAGHESAGITAPATEWFLAEGATGSYFDLFVLVANPGTADAQVEATYLLPGRHNRREALHGGRHQPVQHLGGLRGREARRHGGVHDDPVHQRCPGHRGAGDVVAGPTPATWHEAHNSAGATTTGTTWALAEGEVDTARNMETYILVANTSITAATVKVTLLFEDGTQRRADLREHPRKEPVQCARGRVLPTGGRQAVRRDRGEPRDDAGADRRRARDVLGRGRATLGGRHQRTRDEVAVATNQGRGRPGLASLDCVPHHPACRRQAAATRPAAARRLPRPRLDVSGGGARDARGPRHPEGSAPALSAQAPAAAAALSR